MKIKEFFKIFEDMDLKTLEGYRNLLIFILIADIFGVFWFLKLKSLGTAIMVVCLIFMGIILFYERRKTDKMPKKKRKQEEDPPVKKKKKKVDDEDDEEEEYYDDESDEMDFGLPNADDYSKRLEKAIGM